MPVSVNEDDEEVLKRAIAMSLEEQSRSEEDESDEELLAKAIAMSLEV